MSSLRSSLFFFLDDLLFGDLDWDLELDTVYGDWYLSNTNESSSLAELFLSLSESLLRDAFHCLLSDGLIFCLDSI